MPLVLFVYYDPLPRKYEPNGPEWYEISSSAFSCKYAIGQRNVFLFPRPADTVQFDRNHEHRFQFPQELAVAARSVITPQQRQCAATDVQRFVMERIAEIRSFQKESQLAALMMGSCLRFLSQLCNRVDISGQLSRQDL